MKTKTMLVAVATLASLLSVATVAQATPAHFTSMINGKVVDSVDQHPLGGVQVDVFDDSSRSQPGKAIATTMTRDDGSFLLLGLRGGTYHLELVKRGYALEIVTGLSLGPDERIFISQPFGMRSAVVTTGLGQAMETRI
jgi:Carboxypeptidase regulatory-like domain